MLNFLQYVFGFIGVVLTIVIVHEFGHYLVAKLCGVKVDVFSVGFGKEIIGFNDKSGTRWKLSLIPLGGYVKMFGDSGAASMPDNSIQLTAKEKKASFHYKKIWQKICIVVAGPIANFIFAILIITFITYKFGISYTKPVISSFSEKSPAQESGLQIGDMIISINGHKMESFNDVKNFMAINVYDVLSIKFTRNGKEQELLVTPKVIHTNDIFGNKIDSRVLGVASSEIEMKKVGLFMAFNYSLVQTYQISVATLEGLGQIISGKRSVKEIGGPIRIIKYSGQSVSHGWIFVIFFIAMISINLGLVNLLPIPLLDGGHLFTYLLTIINGKPLSPKQQELFVTIGIVIIGTLMIVAVFNDIVFVFFTK